MHPTIPGLKRLSGFWRLRARAEIDTAHQEPAVVAEDRPLADLLAGCEYELGQVARDVARTRDKPRQALVTRPRVSQPFAISNGLRNPDVRRQFKF